MVPLFTAITYRSHAVTHSFGFSFRGRIYLSVQKERILTKPRRIEIKETEAIKERLELAKFDLDSTSFGGDPSFFVELKDYITRICCS